MMMASPFYSSYSVTKKKKKKKDGFFLMVVYHAWGLSSDLNGYGFLSVPLQLIRNIPRMIRLL